MKTITDLGFKLRESSYKFPGIDPIIRYQLIFDNGYGLSAIQGLNTYSGEKTYEIDILKRFIDSNDDEYWELCYPITNDVLGYQTLDEIEKIIEQVKSYKEDEY